MSAITWNGEAARPHVVSAVARKKHLFAPWPDLGVADLIQEGMERARAVQHKYDPAKASYATWIGRVVGFRLIDIWRTRARQLDKEMVARAVMWASQAGKHEDVEREPQNVHTWLIAVHAGCRGMWPEIRREGRPGYPKATVAAVGLLMRRMRLTTRGARMLFQMRPELARVLKFRDGRVPSQMWFSRAGSFVSQSRKIIRGVEKAREEFSAANVDVQVAGRITHHAEAVTNRSATG